MLDTTCVARAWPTSLTKVLQTFRLRLAAWNAAVVILTAVVTLIVLRQGVRLAILHEMDQILMEDIGEIALAVHELDGGQFPSLREDLERKAVGHKHHAWFVQLLDEENRIIWASAGPPELRLPRASPQSKSPYTLGEYRLAWQAIPPAAYGISTIRVGSSLRFLEEDMARIDRTVMLATGIVLVLAPAIGFWLASRAVKPVADITRTAARVRPSHMEDRLPVRGTGDELDHLAQTVNSLLDRIADYLQQRRDFLANAAHELRTPLAAIRSSVEVALGSGRSREEYEDLLVQVIDHSDGLETLVNQLLLISETEAERLKHEYSVVALDEVVARSIDMFRGVAESRNIALELNTTASVAVHGNLNLLRQLVNNLIDNAIKYTPAGGRIVVELTWDEDRSGVALTVEDNGIGIDAEDVPYVFDRFFRVDRSRSRMSETVGTGLGLSICQAVADAHGGTITCHSTPAQRTRMRVWLPMSPSSNRHANRPVEAPLLQPKAPGQFDRQATMDGATASATTLPSAKPAE